jgi:hypothetical protein
VAEAMVAEADEEAEEAEGLLLNRYFLQILMLSWRSRSMLP